MLVKFSFGHILFKRDMRVGKLQPHIAAKRIQQLRAARGEIISLDAAMLVVDSLPKLKTL